jgi:hypothetical protein
LQRDHKRRRYVAIWDDIAGSKRKRCRHVDLFPGSAIPKRGAQMNTAADTAQRIPLFFAALFGIGFLATFLWAGALGWMVLRLTGML